MKVWREMVETWDPVFRDSDDGTTEEHTEGPRDVPDALVHEERRAWNEYIKAYRALAEAFDA